MNRKSPNENYQIEKEFFPFYLGKNQVSKLFLRHLLPIFSTNYKEGSALATFYKDIKEGKSEVYVEQPILEKKLWNDLIIPSEDSTKYLVGATGVGKTTLIRNVFQVFDRKPVIIKNNLIIYHSFYNMEPSKELSATIDIYNGIINTIESTCTFLSGYKSKIKRLESYKSSNFYEDFHAFIMDNNSNLESKVQDDFEFVDSLTEKNMYAKAIDSIKKKDRIDYEMTLLKYYVKQYCSKPGNHIQNIVFIFDDIEAQHIEYQDYLLEIVWSIKKCMGHQKSNSEFTTPYIKMLVALRNFSFRIQQNIHVQKDEAHREIPANDVILKDEVPFISQIVKKRVDYILSHEDLISQIDNKDKWLESIKVLDNILSKTYGQYDTMLLYLTHYNLFYSMILLMRIITNKKFLGKYEIFDDDDNSAFVIRSDIYRLNNPSKDPANPGNDDVFYSMVYGENDVYFSYGDYYLTNILRNKEKDGYSTEIWGPYIIHYLIKNNIVAKSSAMYNFEASDQIVKKVLSVFNWADEAQREIQEKTVNKTMAYYYVSGVLRESIIKPRNDMRILKSPNREYSKGMNVYLSTRGYQLYNMLKSNSLLLQVYRDDIETTLPNNNICSLNLLKEERVKYCLQYINMIRLRELEMLFLINNGDEFVNTFGTETLAVHLLEGIRQTIVVYYSQNTPEKRELIRIYNDIVSKENDNISEINNSLDISLDFANPIDKTEC